MTGHDTVVILDYGSQTTQLIARRVREAGVFSLILPWDASKDEVMALNPRGFILSGGPNSVYESGAPTLPGYVTASKLPVLGICYGMQLLTHHLGGKVAASADREFGPAMITLMDDIPLWQDIPMETTVWMSHGDRIEEPPAGFRPAAYSSNSPVASMADPARGIYGVQFHPEVAHTKHGEAILQNFVLEVCGCSPTWTAAEMIESAIHTVQEITGHDGRVLLGLSGGVDSSVAAALIHRAIGDRLTCVFIDTGLLRKDEAEQVVQTFQREMGLNLVAVNAAEDFLSALDGITEPEAKRKVIGELFIRLFEREAARLSDQFDFLAQGTIYPDVIESASKDKPHARTIKSHHNVGGLPEDMVFKLVEPLRDLFKDEVRRVGTALGLPDEIVWRQPFPGPGLAIRCIGEINWERLERLRAADAIFIQELSAANMLKDGTAQAFTVLLPVKTVGVMGDARTYAEVIALRAVSTDDFMTADWTRLPYDLIAKVSARIVNEVEGVNRVVYDITSKPPATIEWE